MQVVGRPGEGGQDFPSSLDRLGEHRHIIRPLTQGAQDDGAEDDAGEAVLTAFGGDRHDLAARPGRLVQESRVQVLLEQGEQRAGETVQVAGGGCVTWADDGDGLPSRINRLGQRVTIPL